MITRVSLSYSDIREVIAESDSGVHNTPLTVELFHAPGEFGDDFTSTRNSVIRPRKYRGWGSDGPVYEAFVVASDSRPDLVDQCVVIQVLYDGELVIDDDAEVIT